MNTAHPCRDPRMAIRAIVRASIATSDRTPMAYIWSLALAELLHRLVRQVILAETERLDQSDMLRRANELLQLIVEGLIELLVLLAESKSAVALDRFSGHLSERLRRLDAFALLGHVGDGERGQRCGIGPAGLHGRKQARLIGEHHELRLGNAGVLGVARLDSTGHHG